MNRSFKMTFPFLLAFSGALAWLSLPGLAQRLPPSEIFTRQPADLPITQPAIQPAVERPSVDAIAVFSRFDGGQNDLYYSFYGHNPAVPVPVDEIDEWLWWSLDAGGEPAAMITETLAGDDQNPSVAFSKQGWAIVAWSKYRQVGETICSGLPSPVYQGDILFAVWDGEKWSQAATAVEGAPDVNLFDPAIAIDGMGDGLLLYLRTDTLRDAEGCPADFPGSVEYARFQGEDQAFLEGGVLEGPVSPAMMAGPEVAFTSRVLSSTFTSNQAVAGWWTQDEIYSKLCTDPFPYTIYIPSFWPKQAIWNGDAFETPGFIPDKPVVPPDLSANLSVEPGKKLGVSTDMFDHATLAWGVGMQSGDPCESTTVQPQTWSASWDGEAWHQKAASFDTPAAPARGIDLAHLDANQSLAVYDMGDLPQINWSLRPYSATWDARGQLGGAGGYSPVVASLAHSNTVTLWTDDSSGQSEILWSEIKNQDLAGGAWSAPQTLAPGGGQPDLAAHTGSPTLPKTRWGFFTYQAADQAGGANLMAYLTEKSKNNYKEMEIAAKETGGNLLVVGLFDRHTAGTPNTTYVQFSDKAEELKPKKWKPANLNSADPITLQNFIAETVERFPVSNTLLILSDHGGGWRGACQDQLSPGAGGNDILTMPEIRQAMFGALGRTIKGKPVVPEQLQILGFQACLMSQVEAAYELKDFSEFYIGHESLGFAKPGTSHGAPWNFQTIIPKIASSSLWNNPGLVAVDMFKEIEAQIDKLKVKANLAALNLDELDDLAKRLDELAAELVKQMPNFKKEIQAAVKATMNFPAPDSAAATFSNDYRDIQNFTQQLKLKVKQDDVKAKADEVYDAVEGNAVFLYSDPNGAYPCNPPGDVFTCGGLSIWIPLDGKLFDDHKDKGYNYAALDINKTYPNWMDFLSKLHDSKTVVVELSSAEGLLFHSIVDQQGRFVGLDPANTYDDTDAIGLCSAGVVEIEGADYASLGGVKTIYLPGNITHFTWTVESPVSGQQSAISGQQSAEETVAEAFSLAIQVWQDGGKLYEQVIAGVIEVGQAISGEVELPASWLFLPVVQR